MNKKFLLLTLCSVLLFIFSCNWDDTGIIKDSDTPIQTEIGKTNVEKTSNPFNSLGILHNEFLRNMAKMDSTNLNTTTLDMIISSAKTFIGENGYDTNVFSANVLGEIANEAMNSQLDNAKIDNLGMSYNFTDSYRNELYRLSEFLNANNNYASTNELINHLQNVENDFNNANVNANERKKLQAIITIAKSSLEYWSKIFSNDILFHNNNNSQWFSRIFTGVKTDILGAIIGSEIGDQINSEKMTAGVIVGATVASGGIQLQFMQ